MNTVDELVKKLQVVSDSGFGGASVMLEGCDCTNDWDGKDFWMYKDENGNVTAVEICCTL